MTVHARVMFEDKTILSIKGGSKRAVRALAHRSNDSAILSIGWKGDMFWHAIGGGWDGSSMTDDPVQPQPLY